MKYTFLLLAIWSVISFAQTTENQDRREAAAAYYQWWLQDTTTQETRTPNQVETPQTNTSTPTTEDTDEEYSTGK